MREKELGTYELLAELFRQGQTRGEICPDLDPLQLGEVLTGIYVFTVVNWLVGWWGKGDDLASRMMRAVDIFLNGCQTDASSGRIPTSRLRTGAGKL